jgi:hypothetical protein
MIDPKPSWSFAARKHLYLWYGHVHLLPEYAIGQWFAVKRNSGECLWENGFDRTNNIFEITNGVILADETRSDGPWTASFGCYAISLATGAVLWKWHGTGVRGILSRVLEPVTIATSEFRPGFYGIRGNEAVTKQGHVLDLQTGMLLRREKEISIPRKNYEAETAAQRIYGGQPVAIGDNLSLSTREPGRLKEKRPDGILMISHPKPTRPFGFILRNHRGQTVWDWSPSEAGLHPVTNYFGWRLVGSELFILCAEGPTTVPINPQKPMIVRRCAAKYRLLCLDALTGKVVQDIPLTEKPLNSCRIEDVDQAGMLISHDERVLNYYSLKS